MFKVLILSCLFWAPLGVQMRNKNWASFGYVLQPVSGLGECRIMLRVTKNQYGPRRIEYLGCHPKLLTRVS